MYNFCVAIPDFNSSIIAKDYAYRGCYSYTFADAVYETSYMTNAICEKFCGYLNYNYAATSVS